MRRSFPFGLNPYSTNTLASVVRALLIPRAITVHLSPMSTQSFQLRLNPLTGESEWVVITEEENERDNNDKNPSSSKSLLAHTSYLDMLNDSCRNRAYRGAIEAAITRPCHVIDIGAGTGLLSMMAARAMASVGGEKEGRVSACESYLPMVKLMRRVLRENGMDNKVKLFPKRSDEIRVGCELDSRADLMVSEILDSELLGEGLIPTLQHAHDELLVPNPQMIPYRATTYGQLVESTFLRKLCDLHNQEISASDGIQLSPVITQNLISLKPKQYAMQCDALSSEIKLLSEPFKVFEFDFWKRPESNREAEITVQATNEGTVHAIISWWVLQLDEAGSIFYSTAPKWISSQYITNSLPGKDWCDHWKQCVWFIHDTGLPTLRGKNVSIRASHNDISISYDTTPEVNKNNSSILKWYEERIITLLPERIGLYGDGNWRLAFITAIRNALNRRSSPLCVVADDSVFLTVLLSSLSESSNVIAFFPGLKDNGTQYIKAVSASNGFSSDRVRVLESKVSSFAMFEKKIEILVGEPFYYGNEGMLPWQNLRFWRERSLLDLALAEDALVVPCKGILKICAVSLPDLWRSRCSLRDVEGFDHSSVNQTLGACGNLPEMQQGPCLAFYLWQCGEIEKLSQVYQLMDFNISKPIHSCLGKLQMKFLKPGLCHGFAIWIDWVLDEMSSNIVSTGPDSRYWKQGVQLLSVPQPVNSTTAYCAEVEASFDHLTGELSIKSSFS
ncbi:Protein arginine N-methyltransferase 7 [Rhynchospora pubera]|uniref:Protein arginine N-methyltransferase 7 n=1 Tax=Rhynchospora pubera TaxID=906938 RepID=A0AAV8E4C4_9POAL|nr:Protein arginine N-methyltransferase 7 [Rhynchospora pubera]